MSGGYWNGDTGESSGWFEQGPTGRPRQPTTQEVLNRTLDKVSSLSQEILADLSNPNATATARARFMQVRYTATQARAAVIDLLTELDRIGA